MKVEYDRDTCIGMFQCVDEWEGFERDEDAGKAELADAEEPDEASSSARSRRRRVRREVRRPRLPRRGHPHPRRRRRTARPLTATPPSTRFSAGALRRVRAGCDRRPSQRREHAGRHTPTGATPPSVCGHRPQLEVLQTASTVYTGRGTAGPTRGASDFEVAADTGQQLPVSDPDPSGGRPLGVRWRGWSSPERAVNWSTSRVETSEVR